jgi:hypothetical protein
MRRYWQFLLYHLLALVAVASLEAWGDRVDTAPPISTLCSQDQLLAGHAPVPPLHQLSRRELDSLLAALHEEVPSFPARVRALALARLGAPYVLGPLGEGTVEDPDPVFRVDQVDCTVLVLTTVAMAEARSVAEAERWMGPANYRKSSAGYAPSYARRLHYTEDRLVSSPLFADVTRSLADSTELRTVEIVLNRKADGSPLLPIDWERPMTLAYVPAEKLGGVLRRAPDLLGLALVRESYRPRGLLVAHEGLLLDRHCFLHASAEAKAAVVVDWPDYFLRLLDPDPTKVGRPRFDGAILYELRDAAADRDVGLGVGCGPASTPGPPVPWGW